MNSPKNVKTSKRRKQARSNPPPLRESVGEAIAHFLDTLDGEPCSELYDMVLHQMEEPLFKAVMHYTHHNQSHAATMLGLNRGTLRKKLRQHGLLDEPERHKQKRSVHRHSPPASKASSRRKR